MTRQTTAFVAITAAIGIAVVINALWNWQCDDPLRFAAYLAFAFAAIGLKVVVPGANGTMSVTFIFILLGILELSVPETIVIGCTATLVQCFWKMKRPRPAVRILFNVCSMMAPAIWISALLYRHSDRLFGHNMPLMLLAATCAFFLTNTIPIAMVISLSEQRPFRKAWSECHLWAFPYYLAGASLVALFHYANRFAGWQNSMLILPVVYWIYRSYRLYVDRLEDEKRRVEDEKRHVEDVASLHLRTIEALALAIDAKDHTTHDHLQRVRVYALEIGKEIGLNSEELEALKAAALLHDIGKLAVPEHIITKPSKLTAEEFEKMKIHPVVGAEILQRVAFPYPVVPIVRAHHEKWDGSGYPDGLRGEQIPIGARILTAVDCLDALASDRQYRRALPLGEAMEYVSRLAGKDFDPQVVDILKRRFRELEAIANSQPAVADLSLSTDVKIQRGAAPDAGLERESRAPVNGNAGEGDFLASLAAARREGRMLFELSHELGKSLSIDQILSVTSDRVRKIVPYDAIAIWMREADVLVPKLVIGDGSPLFASLKIPIGQGLSGWVVQNDRTILNGNPSIEPSYLNDSSKFSTLHSALSVPLDGLDGPIGALTLYRAEPDAFNQNHLRLLLAVSSKLVLSIENALRFQNAQSATDYLTGLPSSRSLFMHLDGELARCKRNNTELGILICDLDGFKEVNDRFGHLEGNKMLRLFAHGLRRTCREYDYVARLGGDEFIVVAPGLEPQAAQDMGVRINELAKAAAIQIAEGAALSVSIGSAFFTKDGIDAEQLLAEADRRMYDAKQAHYRGENTLSCIPIAPARGAAVICPGDFSCQGGG